MAPETDLFLTLASLARSELKIQAPRLVIQRAKSCSLLRKAVTRSLALLLSLLVSSALSQGTVTRTRAQRGILSNNWLSSAGRESGRAQQGDKDVRVLEPGKPIVREMATGGTHFYRIFLSSSQFIHVVIDQRGIDLVVTLFGPDGKQILRVDSPNGSYGPESVSLMAETSGKYLLKVSSLLKRGSAGQYEVKLEDLRTATPRDGDRVVAERALVAGERLRNQRRAESQRAAIKKYVEALSGFRAVGDRYEEALTLLTLGQTERVLGNTLKALDYYNLSLSIFQSMNDRSGEAASYIGISTINFSLGKKQEALYALDKALLLCRSVGNREIEADTLHRIGQVYQSLGEPRKALDYYNKVLPFWRKAGVLEGEANTLNDIGAVYAELGDQRQALYHYNRALYVLSGSPDNFAKSTVLSNTGWSFHKLGDRDKALKIFQEALQVKRIIGDRAGEASTLNNVGWLYFLLGDKHKALDYLRGSLEINQQIMHKEDEGDVLSNIMSVWEALGKPSVAIFYGKQAVNTYQEIRANIQGLEQESQRSYLKSKEDTYRVLADLLVSNGRLIEAQQVLDVLKEEEFFEFVKRNKEKALTLNTRVDSTPKEEELEKRYREIKEDLINKGRQYDELYYKGDLTEDEKQRLADLKQDLAVANRALDSLLKRINTELSKQNNGSSAVAREGKRIYKPLMTLLKELGGGTVALYTIVASDKYTVIVITPYVSKAEQYSISKVQLYRKVMEFREALQNSRVDVKERAKDLYEVMVGPIAKELKEAGAKTLIWYLDGVLRYVPIAALYDGKTYMVESYRNVAFTPSTFTLLRDRSETSTKWRVLGLGVSKGYEGFVPLPEVVEELNSIVREEGNMTGGTLPGKVMLDEAFTKDAMESELRHGYTIVHIASHFKFQPGKSDDSYLLLGNGQHLTVEQLGEYPTLFRGVDLLTLSACNTALGSPNAEGTEVDGFAESAQIQGAQSVVATLWSVADVSTSRLMKKFYQLRENQPDLNKAETLRQAQLALLRGEVRAPDGKAYAHPYYWAPFVLIGNWK